MLHINDPSWDDKVLLYCTDCDIPDTETCFLFPQTSTSVDVTPVCVGEGTVSTRPAAMSVSVPRATNSVLTGSLVKVCGDCPLSFTYSCIHLNVGLL